MTQTSDAGFAGLPAEFGAHVARLLELLAGVIDLIGIAIVLFGFCVALPKLLLELSRDQVFARISATCIRRAERGRQRKPRSRWSGP